MLTANFTDSDGNTHDLSAENISDLAAELPEDYQGPSIKVYDEPGFVRGWVRSRTDWTAQ